MPHIHGVAWIDKSYLKKEFGIKEETFLCAEENSMATAKLADRLISCQLPNDVEESDENRYKHPSLGNIVREVQIHRPPPSCLKYNGTCRYHFPRLPCDKTVVARPFDAVSYTHLTLPTNREV